MACTSIYVCECVCVQMSVQAYAFSQLVFYISYAFCQLPFIHPVSQYTPFLHQHSLCILGCVVFLCTSRIKKKTYFVNSLLLFPLLWNVNIILLINLLRLRIRPVAISLFICVDQIYAHPNILIYTIIYLFS